jgi:4-hydroxythreonine-4-phosphate dehydrogenase
MSNSGSTNSGTRRRRIAITPGEPAGIGPDLALALADLEPTADLIYVCDPALLAQRAAALGREARIEEYDARSSAGIRAKGTLRVSPVPLRAPAIPGRLDVANAPYVLATLDRAIAGCLHGEFDALVTGPVQKSIINEAGHEFTGHTEYLAEQTRSGRPVMMLVAGELRVALATTHLALRDVAGSISRALLVDVIAKIESALTSWFGIAQPTLTVCGLNPHAGESGHLGREEIEIIAPALAAYRGGRMRVVGPVPADTAFTQEARANTDAILCMYHDQGLPTLKALGFGQAVNVTLGLPFVRTSVDHGTALDRAGTGLADTGSMRAALELAMRLCVHTIQPHPTA